MPIYEFRCLQCEKEFEKLVMGGNSRAVECPDCGVDEVEKKFSVFGIKTSGNGGDFSGSVGGGGCGSCSSGNCSPCH